MTKAFLQQIKYWQQQRKFKQQITAKDIVCFLRQFAVLLTAGVPILQACSILEKSQVKIALRLLVYHLQRELQAGRQLAYCMQQYPLYFNELICQLVQLGEQTGKLESVLIHIANNEENKLLLRQHIKQTLFYPSIILITALLLLVCMLLFVIPRFAELFEDVRDKLPLLTRAIFTLSIQLKNNCWLFIAMCILLYFALRMSKKINTTKHLVDTAFTHLPILREYLQKIRLAHFIRNMSIACSASVPILQALQLANPSKTYAPFNTALAAVNLSIRAGESMHQAMGRHTLFPSFVIQMIKIGEQTGMLDTMLAKTADFLEADIEQLTLQLGQALEPLIMIMLGVLIGGLVISMYLPIFKLGSTL